MPTTAERITALETELAQIKRSIGPYNATISREDIASLGPTDQLESGDYAVFYNLKQIRYAFGDFFEQTLPEVWKAIRELQARPSGTVQVPTPQPATGGGLSAGADGVFWLPAPFSGGSAIYFESDTNFTGGQRPSGTRYRQVFGFSESGDGGGGLHMNVVYPENGERAYIPDPTRFAVSWRLDRQGMMSINIQRAGAEFAPGKFAITAVHKGQLAVWIPEENGDLTLRLPQGGRLLVEKGNGNADRVNGHKATVSRQEVLLGADVGSPAVSGMPLGT